MGTSFLCIYIRLSYYAVGTESRVHAVKKISNKLAKARKLDLNEFDQLKSTELYTELCLVDINLEHATKFP